MTQKVASCNPGEIRSSLACILQIRWPLDNASFQIRFMDGITPYCQLRSTSALHQLVFTTQLLDWSVFGWRLPCKNLCLLSRIEFNLDNLLPCIFPPCIQSPWQNAKQKNAGTFSDTNESWTCVMYSTQILITET